MQDALRREFHRQAVESGEVVKAKNLTIEMVRVEVVPPLDPDDMISPMAFSARLLNLNERSSFVWISWAAENAHHIEDEDTRKALTDHVRRTRLLSMKLDAQKSYKIWVKEALVFAREQGWLDEAPMVAHNFTHRAAETPTERADRRLLRLRALDGTADFRNNNWSFTGVDLLEQVERSDGAKGCTDKTLRKDLKEACEREVLRRREDDDSQRGATKTRTPWDV